VSDVRTEDYAVLANELDNAMLEISDGYRPLSKLHNDPMQLAKWLLKSDWLDAHNEERDALRAWKVNAQITLDYDKVQLDALADVIEATKAALNAEEDTHEVPDMNEWADAYRVENALKFLSSYQEAVK